MEDKDLTELELGQLIDSLIANEMISSNNEKKKKKDLALKASLIPMKMMTSKIKKWSSSP